jgi:acyl-coenzyme A thioesterase PaaI-like protein
VITDKDSQHDATIAHPAHACCVLCGRQNPWGFNLVFRRGSDGSVEGTLRGNGHCQGYPDMMHGGIISLLLDGAMTNCLFLHGRTGVTARMEMKFHHPVRSGDEVTVSASIERSSHPVYWLKAQLLQDGQVKATASGVFMHRSDLDPKRGAT